MGCGIPPRSDGDPPQPLDQVVVTPKTRRGSTGFQHKGAEWYWNHDLLFLLQPFCVELPILDDDMISNKDNFMVILSAPIIVGRSRDQHKAHVTLLQLHVHNSLFWVAASFLRIISELLSSVDSLKTKSIFTTPCGQC